MWRTLTVGTPLFVIFGVILYLGSANQREPIPYIPFAAPTQAAVEPSTWTTDTAVFTTNTTLAGRTRIISTRTYWFGGLSKVSKTDLVMGWGGMTDPSMYSEIGIKQSKRWIWVKYDPARVGEIDISTMCANVHIISASPQVAARVAGLRAGDVIDFGGYLVNVTLAKTGEEFTTSLSRDDKKAGACEILYLTDITTLPR